jgi:hypothetical protein
VQRRITDQIIDQAVEKFRTTLRARSSEISAAAARRILVTEHVGDELFATFRSRVERESSVIVRRVRPDRSLSPQQAVDATERSQFTHQFVVDSMPKPSRRVVKLVFFKPEANEYTQRTSMSDGALTMCFARRNLEPADPFSLLEFNKEEPGFADTRPHGTHWQDADGNWCYATFSLDGMQRKVHIYCHGGRWHCRWWFVGVPLK